MEARNLILPILIVLLVVMVTIYIYESYKKKRTAFLSGQPVQRKPISWSVVLFSVAAVVGGFLLGFFMFGGVAIFVGALPVPFLILLLLLVVPLRSYFSQKSSFAALALSVLAGLVLGMNLGYLLFLVVLYRAS